MATPGYPHLHPRYIAMDVNDFLRQWHDSSDYIVAHTSGSTGAPKEIRLLKADMRASARATNAYFGISGTSTLALPLSPDYIAGKMMIVRALEARCRLAILPVSNTIVLDEHVDLISVVPSQTFSLIDQSQLARKIGAVLIGGAAPSPGQLAGLRDAGYRAWVSYGMTETCSHVALRDVSISDDSPYQAVPGVTFSLDDRGCLVVHCSHMSVGTLVTNDVCTLLSSTEFRWRGRADGVIVSGGIKIIPEEIEARLVPGMGAIPFYIAGRPHGKWGHVPVLVAEATEDMRGRIEAAVASAPLSAVERPRTIELHTSLPRTTSGKLRRL